MKGRLNTWLLIVVGVCALSLWFGKDLVRTGEVGSSVGSPSIDTETDYSLSPEETTIHLAVLNGTSEAGLAREVSLLLGRAGCVAERFGNAPHRNFSGSLLINRRLTGRQAADLARRLGGIRVIREWDGRGGEDAVLVLGTDSEHLTASLLDKRK